MAKGNGYSAREIISLAAYSLTCVRGRLQQSANHLISIRIYRPLFLYAYVLHSRYLRNETNVSPSISIFISIFITPYWLMHCYKPEGRGFDTLWGVFF
jgi:hypothetical protein